MKRIATTLFVSVSVLAPAALGATLFQGIYKMNQGTNHVGFLVAKRETLANGNIKTTARIVLKSGDTETLVMETDASLRPVSLTETKKLAANVTTFTGTLKGETFTTTKTTESTTNPNVKGSSSLTVKVPASSHFPLVIPDLLKAKGLYKVGAKMTVVQLTSDPGLIVADAVVEKDETVAGVKTKKVVVKPKDLSTGLTFWVADTFEPIRVIVNGVVAESVATLAEASKGMTVDEAKLAADMGGPVKSELKALSAPAK
jgi:hypothetical protein